MFFSVDEAGKPHILIEGQPGLESGGANENWDHDREQLLKFATELVQDWPDDAYVQLFPRGADDLSSQTQLLSSLSALHMGSMKHSGEFVEELRGELARQFLSAPSWTPGCVPIRCVPPNLFKKGDASGGGFRLLFNSIWSELRKRRHSRGKCQWRRILPRR